MNMRIAWISALAIAIVCGWQAFAQTSAGVKGVVTDSSGALVAGAMIFVTNLDTGAWRETATNESGVYQIPLLQPGRYTIAARKQGFKQAGSDALAPELETFCFVSVDQFHVRVGFRECAKLIQADIAA